MEAVTPSLLEGIFEKQKELMNAYVKVGKLNPFPVALDTKPGQKDIRETISCVIQELSEAYDSAEDVFTNLSENNTKEAEVAHANFHEELADVMHFFIELLTQSGIDYGDMPAYLEYIGVVPGDKPEDTLTMFMKNARQQNMQTLPDKVSRKDCFIVPTTKVHHRALTRVNLELLLQYASFNWGITNSLMKAQNKLRAQPWRDQVYSVDVRSYQSHLMEAFEYLIRLYEWLGMTDQSLSYIYQQKNTVNFERLKEGY